MLTGACARDVTLLIEEKGGGNELGEAEDLPGARVETKPGWLGVRQAAKMCVLENFGVI